METLKARKSGFTTTVLFILFGIFAYLYVKPSRFWMWVGISVGGAILHVLFTSAGAEGLSGVLFIGFYAWLISDLVSTLKAVNAEIDQHNANIKQ